mgnify:CR=1 FL=1
MRIGLTRNSYVMSKEIFCVTCYDESTIEEKMKDKEWTVLDIETTRLFMDARRCADRAEELLKEEYPGNITKDSPMLKELMGKGWVTITNKSGVKVTIKMAVYDEGSWRNVVVRGR